MLNGAVRAQEINNARIPSLFRKQLEKCKVREGETVVVLSDLTVRDDYINAAIVGAEELGANAYEIRLGTVPSWIRVGVDVISQCKGAMDALTKADLIVMFHVPIWADWMQHVLKAGGRILLIHDSPDDLEELMAPEGLKEAVQYSESILKKARTGRMTRKDGTDLRWTGGQYGTFALWGAADEKGHWDLWGGGFVQMFPNDGSANGRVILQPGDIVILPYCRYVSDPVDLQIKDGIITSIDGGLDAKLIRDWLVDNQRSPDDTDPFAVSHLGWGLNPQARWYWGGLYGDVPERNRANARVFAGNFLFSTGPNTLGGGNRETMGHCDIPMRDCTVTIDDKLIMDEGRFVDPKMIVKREVRGAGSGLLPQK
ncbi:hypothetical protein ACPWR0_10985 [Pandoraea pneumonica]|uniref:hypothetical protein n=1 Tax=Pandoraea pneumonica TaxID=2508299 RepID=UPI003CEC617A